MNIHILTFTPRQINVYYIVSVQASNTWGANTFNFNVTEYAEVEPSLKNYSSLDIQLSNQVFVFNYNDYFFGLMQEFYIVSNPISTIKLIDTSIYTISTSLYEYSNYDIVFGVNNIYGSNEFTLHVTDYKQDVPQFKNESNHFVELSNQYVTYIIEDIFDGLIQNIYLTYNPVGNIKLYDCNVSNIAVLWNDVYSYSNYTIGIGVSNVFGSNEYLIYVTDFLNEAPFVIHSIPNQFILSNVTIALDLEYYFRGFIQYYTIVHSLNNAIIENSNMFIYSSNIELNYDIIVTSHNIYGSNSITFNFNEYTYEPPRKSDDIYIELSNVDYIINLNTIFDGLVDYYYIHTNIHENTFFTNSYNNEIRISWNTNSSSNIYNISIGASNVFGSNEWIINVKEHAEIPPKLIEENISLQYTLKDSNIKFEYSGLLQDYSIITPYHNIIIENYYITINNCNIDSNYEITIILSNVFGSTEFKTRIDQWEMVAPKVIDNINIELFLTPFTYNLKDAFTGYVDFFYIHTNPQENIELLDENLKINGIFESNVYTSIIGASNLYGHTLWNVNITDYKRTNPEYIDGISNIDLFLSNQEFIFNYNDYFTGLMQQFYILSNPFASSNTIIETENIFTISTQLYNSNYYDLVFGISNVFGSNEFTLHITDYKQTKPEYIDGISNIHIELSNQEFIFNYNDYFTGLMQEFYIISNPFASSNTIIKTENIFTISTQLFAYSNYDLVFGVSNVFGSNEFTLHITDYKRTKPEYINDISNIDIELSNQEIIFNYNDYFTGLMQEFYILSNPFASSNTIIETENIFTISTQLFAYSNYDLVLGVSNVFGSNEFTLHVTDYKQFKPEYINDISNIDIELSNQEFIFNYNDYFTGLMQEFYILSNPFASSNTIIETDNIFTISTQLFAYSNYDLVFGVSNVFGSNEFTLHVTDYKRTNPEYIDGISNIDLFLSNQEFIFNYNDYFTGLMQEFYILSNQFASSNTIIKTENIFTISTQLFAYSNYDLVFGVSNVFGSNEFTLHITDYKRTKPEYINDISNIDIELSNQEFIFNYNDYFTGLMQEFYILSNPFASSNTIIETENIFTISTQLFAYSNYDLVLGVSNVFGSNEFTLHVTDYKQFKPEYINDISNIDIELSNQEFIFNYNDYFTGLMENYYILSNPFASSNTIVETENIFTISTQLFAYSNYDLVFGVSNVFGSNEFTLHVTDYKRTNPEYIDGISNIDLFLSNQEFIFNYNDYFTGLMENYYIISNPFASSNTIIETDNIFTISTKLYNSNYYDLVFGVSNVFGSNEFTLHVTDYKQDIPGLLNLLSTQTEKLIAEF